MEEPAGTLKQLSPHTRNVYHTEESMGDQAMPLRDEDIKRIGDYVKPWIREFIDAAVPQPAVAGIDTQLLERMVRVEEELKSQRELMDERFSAMEGRFVSMDRRFEDLIGYMDKRFEAVDRRFEAVDKRFEDLIGYMDKRFEAVGKRFEDLIGHTDKRFEAMDGRFVSMDNRFNDVQASIRSTQWLIGAGFVLITAAIAVFQFLG
jgi:PAS domain-containing protein